MTDSIQLLTISTPDRIIGIDSVEIGRAITKVEEFDQARSTIEELKAKGCFFKLEDILKLREDTDYKSALVLAPIDGKECIVAASGMIDIVKINLADIIPIPDYIKKKQDTVFVWGFSENRENLIMLVTFHFIIAKGAK